MSNLLQEYNEYFSLGRSSTKFYLNIIYDYQNVMPITAVILYYITLKVLPSLLISLGFGGGFPGFMKKIAIVWNLALSLFSGCIFTGILYPYLTRHVPLYSSFLEAVCDPDGKLTVPSPLIFWAWMFVLSKYFELFDTIILIMKKPKREVRFLHWFHHITVLLFTWYASRYEYSAGTQFILYNAMVHTFMYFYYFLTECGIKIHPKIAMALTTLQISQMAYGIFINAFVYYQAYIAGQPCMCLKLDIIMYSALAMYSSYLFLFVQFFVRRYVFARPTPAQPRGGKKGRKKGKKNGKDD